MENHTLSIDLPYLDSLAHLTLLVGGLAARQWAYKAGSLEKEVYKPGDQHHLPFGTAKGYRMPDACFALEYARGNIASMMPFGIFDIFFSTLDFHTLVDTFWISGKAMLENLILRHKI